MSRLVAYREKLNLTQQELSKKSGISVRTIQRIESGIDPKGYTLKALAKALNVDEIDLLNKDNLTVEPNYNLINIINLSSLIVVFIPVVCFLIPLVITLIKKQLNALTKQIITIQILWSVAMIVVYIIGSIINLGELGRDIAVAFLLLLMLANALIILRNSIELNKKNKLYFNLKFSII
ncbi:helix-turn-helix domain-containing protein [Aquimarina sp. AU58]|uniref:helix-turn-helix domain-containing protein n=1 Tax=Aquimarina sp. AU58 TaxID=1874112 RepID=UPI000D656372|nr:helix-turn-helix domain-containing protein [Aquimarina sp. AU58]